MKIWPNPIPSQNLYYRLFPLTPTYIMGPGLGAGRSITSHMKSWVYIQLLSKITYITAYFQHLPHNHTFTQSHMKSCTPSLDNTDIVNMPIHSS